MRVPALHAAQKVVRGPQKQRQVRGRLALGSRASTQGGGGRNSERDLRDDEVDREEGTSDRDVATRGATRGADDASADIGRAAKANCGGGADGRRQRTRDSGQG